MINQAFSRRSPHNLPVISSLELQASGGVSAFSLPDLLVAIAVLMLLLAITVPPLVKRNAQARQARCVSNLKEIERAVLLYADDYKGILPAQDRTPSTGVWWWYKE